MTIGAFSQASEFFPVFIVVMFLGLVGQLIYKMMSAPETGHTWLPLHHEPALAATPSTRPSIRAMREAREEPVYARELDRIDREFITEEERGLGVLEHLTRETTRIDQNTLTEIANLITKDKRKRYVIIGRMKGILEVMETGARSYYGGPYNQIKREISHHIERIRSEVQGEEGVAARCNKILVQIYGELQKVLVHGGNIVLIPVQQEAIQKQIQEAIELKKEQIQLLRLADILIEELNRLAVSAARSAA